MFTKFDHKENGHITYGDKIKGKILGEGVVENPSIITIKGVLFIKQLKQNLLRVSSLCNKRYAFAFNTLSCLIEHKANKSLMIKESRVDNIYFLVLDDVSMYGTKCLVANNENSWLWHRRLGHVHFDLINKITSKNIGVGLPKIKFCKDKLCNTCQMRKQMRVSFKYKNIISTLKAYELLHLDLFSPSKIRSLGGNYYMFVIVDEYSRFTWMIFSAHKEETFKAFVKFSNCVQNLYNLKIITLLCDHGGCQTLILMKSLLLTHV